jgi:hypothetical protein
MTQLPERLRDNQSVGFFTRHLVPIYLELRKGDAAHQMVLSAFAFAALGRWMLVTAGHCITYIEELRACGWHVEKARLLDGLNAQAKHERAYPFDYDSFRPTMLGADPTFDYGILIPTRTAALAMKANNVVPFSEASWGQKRRDFEVYKVLGVPAQLVGSNPNALNITTVFQRLDRLKRRPEGFAETEAPMFYGRLLGDSRVKLQGMSGGPIIGFVDEGGRQRYWLVAMLVSTVRTKYVSGMLMQPLGRFIHERAQAFADEETPSGDD